MANTRARAAVIAGPFAYPGRLLGRGQAQGRGRGRGQAAQGRGAQGRALVPPGWPPAPPEPEPEPEPEPVPPAEDEDDLSAEDDGPTEIGFVLENLGFSRAFINHFVNREGITELNYFLALHTDVVDSIFPRLDIARIRYTSIQRSLIKSLYLYVRRMRQTNTPIDLDAIDFDLLSRETELADYHKAQKSKLTFPSSFKDHTKWRAFKDMFTNYLYSIRGAKNIPLAYVIRPDIIPTGVNPTDPIYSTALQGGQYTVDRSEVYTILERCMLGGPGETYCKEHQTTRNGRKAFLQLDKRFGGGAVTSTKISNAWKTIQSTKYTGKNKKFDFTSYKAALDEAFRDLEEANLPQPDETKVFLLLNGIESESLKRVKDGVVTNPLVCNNYHEATLYISRCIAHDNTVDTEAKLSRNIMSTSSTTTLSARNYPAEEWKQLTKEQQNTIGVLEEVVIQGLEEAICVEEGLLEGVGTAGVEEDALLLDDGSPLLLMVAEYLQRDLFLHLILQVS